MQITVSNDWSEGSELEEDSNPGESKFDGLFSGLMAGSGCEAFLNKGEGAEANPRFKSSPVSEETLLKMGADVRPS